MAKQRYSISQIADDLGMDSRLIVEFFRRLKFHTATGDFETEVEGMGIFHRAHYYIRVWQNRFQASTLQSIDRVALRQARRPQLSRMTIRWPGAWVRFTIEDTETKATLVLSFDDGLLLESLVTRFGTWIRDGEPMEQQRIGFSGSNGPRIFAQFTSGGDKVKFNSSVEIRTRRWTIDEPQSGTTLGSIFTAQEGWGWDFLQEQLIPWNIVPGAGGDDRTAPPNGNALHNWAIISMLRWMARNRTDGNNTGPNWEEDLN